MFKPGVPGIKAPEKEGDKEKVTEERSLEKTEKVIITTKQEKIFDDFDLYFISHSVIFLNKK